MANRNEWATKCGVGREKSRNSPEPRSPDVRCGPRATPAPASWRASLDLSTPARRSQPGPRSHDRRYCLQLGADRARHRRRRRGAQVSTSARLRADRSQGRARTIAATACSSAPAARDTGADVVARKSRPRHACAPIAARAALTRSPLLPSARRRPRATPAPASWRASLDLSTPARRSQPGPRSHDRRYCLQVDAGAPLRWPIAAGVVLGDMRGAARAHQSRPRLAAVRNSSTSHRSSETCSASSSFFAAPASPAAGGESEPSQTGANASAAPGGGQGGARKLPDPSLNSEGKRQ